MEEYIQSELRRKLAEFHLQESNLTPAELRALREEIIAEHEGKSVSESVLSNPEFLYRNIGRCDG